MKIIIINIALQLIIQNISFAQVVNTGGGGPDRSEELYDKEAREAVKKRENEIKKITEDLNKWVKTAKERWRKCHDEKIESNDIVSLYLVIVLREASNKFREECRRESKTDCIFKNKEENDKIYKIITKPEFDDYLLRKGIKTKKSRDEVISFYKKKIKRK
jgi:hypothetical protein